MYLIFFFIFEAYANLPKAFKYELSHPKTFLTLEWDGKYLMAQDKDIHFGFELKKCNQIFLEKFFETHESIWKNRPAQGTNFIQIKRGNEHFKASTYSELGNYLLNLTSTLKMLKAQESLRCPD